MDLHQQTTSTFTMLPETRPTAINGDIHSALRKESILRPKPRSRVMGNSTTSAILHEIEENPSGNHSYGTKSAMTTTNHSKGYLGQPLEIIDRWKIIQDDAKLEHNIESAYNKISTRESHSVSTTSTSTNISDSLEELSSPFETTPFIEGAQKANNGNNTVESKPVLVKKPRPNSLAILSRSHDFIHTLSEELGNQEVLASQTQGYNDNPALNSGYKAVSADTLLQPPKTAALGLQKRRNQRPTSLQIPCILQGPHSAAPYVNSSNDFSFTRHDPPTRQRSYSMPGNTLIEERGTTVVKSPPTPQSHSLDEVLFLLNKKKISRAEIDEQSLLHRAADAGHVKLVKKCIQAGCCVVKRLDSLIGTPALHCAARADKNSAAVTKLLLETGIDVNTTNDLGETAIFSAIIHKNMDTVDLLVDHGCDIDSVWQKSTPLYLMLYNKNLDSTVKTIKKGATITQLPDTVRQPLHAVLDLCHTQSITHQIMQLLRLMVEADGNVIEHLHGYRPNMPGRSEQDIIYHIYRMERGPTQAEGKQLIRSLVKLGYEPTRGELSTMSQSDSDYDYLYSYVKTGTASLKDLCIRTIRKACRFNVIHGVNNFPNLQEKERLQILLQPPENDYENLPVVKRTKEPPKSRPKSLKNLMSGFGRLSRRFSKKHQHADGSTSGGPQLSLPPPSKNLSKELSKSLPVEKPQIKPKPKYTKRETLKPTSAQTVADIVRRYSNNDISAPDCIEDCQKSAVNGNLVAADNHAFEAECNGNIVDREGNHTVDPHNNIEDSTTVRFTDSQTAFSQQEYKTIGDKGQLTPMTIEMPDIQSSMSSLTLYKGSIHIEDEDDQL